MLPLDPQRWTIWGKNIFNLFIEYGEKVLIVLSIEYGDKILFVLSIEYGKKKTF